jgi:hypothetical protein
VCTVSGSTLTKVGNGICTVTATQAGDDYYAKVESVKNIPIGTATSPALTFLSGYKDGSTTKEGGAIGAYAGADANGWWCAGSCTTTVPADGNSLAFSFALPLAKPGASGYYQLDLFATNLNALAKGADTIAGVHIDAQSAIKFNLAQNAEWFGTSNNKVNIYLTLGHHVAKPDTDPTKPATDCNVTLEATMTPTAAASTAYSIGLKDKFTINDSCGLTGLDLWNELQDYPIAKIRFEAASPNFTVANAGSTTYETKVTLSGPITFQ